MSGPNEEPSSATTDEMKIDPARAALLVENLSSVTRAIQTANKSNRPIRLIAVSKLKPASDILSLHSSEPSSTSKPHHTNFGENYVQELIHKASILPKSIRWHFIGGLQTNKCKTLAEKVPNLWAVESVDSSKKADALDKGRAALKETQEGQGEQVGEEKLRVFIQVNTSGEDSKSGTQPGSETLDLCKHVVENCPHLQLQGLMTIGAIARSQAVKEGEENEDFISLTKERDGVLDALGWKEVGERRLELSMGMSADFEQAIQMGSDEVRVGSEIFGARPPKGST